MDKLHWDPWKCQNGEPKAILAACDIFGFCTSKQQNEETNENKKSKKLDKSGSKNIEGEKSKKFDKSGSKNIEGENVNDYNDKIDKMDEIQSKPTQMYEKQLSKVNK